MKTIKAKKAKGGGRLQMRPMQREFGEAAWFLVDFPPVDELPPLAYFRFFAEDTDGRIFYNREEYFRQEEMRELELADFFARLIAPVFEAMRKETAFSDVQNRARLDLLPELVFPDSTLHTEEPAESLPWKTLNLIPPRFAELSDLLDSLANSPSTAVKPTGL